MDHCLSCFLDIVLPALRFAASGTLLYLSLSGIWLRLTKTQSINQLKPYASYIK